MSACSVYQCSPSVSAAPGTGCNEPVNEPMTAKWEDPGWVPGCGQASIKRGTGAHVDEQCTPQLVICQAQAEHSMLTSSVLTSTL